MRHPDAQRRFRVVGDLEELQRALDAPWDKWTVFLHPGTAEASGTALQRAGQGRRLGGHGKNHCRLAPGRTPGKEYPTTRVLLTTFSDTLAKLLRVEIAGADRQSAEAGRTD